MTDDDYYRPERRERDGSPDKLARAVRWQWAYLVLMSLVLVVTTTQGIRSNSDRIKSLHAEAAIRLDQACILFERQHNASVRQLASTYAYLVSLRPTERRQRLSRVILKGLPQVEQTARDNRPPPACSNPGVGLPGPSPRIPRRPPGIG